CRCEPCIRVRRDRVFCWCDDLARSKWLQQRRNRVFTGVSGCKAHTRWASILGQSTTLHPPRRALAGPFFLGDSGGYQPRAHAMPLSLRGFAHGAGRKRKERAVREFQIERIALRLAVARGAALDHEFGPDREAVRKPAPVVSHWDLLRVKLPTQCAGEVTRSGERRVVHVIPRAEKAAVNQSSSHISPPCARRVRTIYAQSR